MTAFSGPGRSHDRGSAEVTHPDRPLLAVLIAHQRRAWRRGERPPVEAYLRGQPGLRDDPEAVLDLIYNEVLLREEDGQTPRLEDYADRFPDLRPQLTLQFEVEGALARTQEGTAGEVGHGEGPIIRSFPLASPAQVPGYQILGELGRGGMGVVYKARHERLNRTVALKMILAAEHAGAEVYARFLAEAEAVARLQHPNIVQIFAFDAHEGNPYIEMEYAEGGSLADRLDGSAWPARDAARLVETLARAIAEVHRVGIVHRDIKPANILLAADGTPKIADFGLAETRDVESRATGTLRLIGSPSYMAPEQAGGGGTVGPSADVYALGAVLYEVVTGRPPFREATVLETLEQVRTTEPRAPGQLRPGLSRDLATICLTCLRKEPTRRYADAGLLAEDLRRFAAGEPIRARPSGRIERVWLWSRRRPALAGLVAAVALLVGTIAVGTPLAAISLRRERDQARRSERVAVERLRQSLLDDARATRLGGRVGQRFSSLLRLSEAAAIRDGADLRDEAIACLALADLRPTRTWPGIPADDIKSGLGFSPDLNLYARAHDRGDLSVRRVSDDAEVHHLTAPGPGHQPILTQFAPGGRHLATVLMDANRQNLHHLVWDVATGAIVLDLPTNWYEAGLGFTPDGTRAIIGLPEKSLATFDLATRREVARWDDSPDLEQIVFNADGKRVAITSGLDKSAQIRDVATGQVLARLPHPASTRGLAWSRDGATLATGCDDQQVYLWDVASALKSAPTRPRLLLAGHNAQIVFLAFGPGDEFLASGSWDGTTRLWDPATGKELVGSSGLAVRLDEAGTRLGFADPPRFGIWDVALGDSLRLCRPKLPEPPPPPNGIRGNYGVAFDPGGEVLASVGAGGVRLWDAATGRELACPTTERSGSAMFRPGDGSLITNGAGGLQLWPRSEGLPDETTGPRFGPPRMLSPPPNAKNWFPACLDGTGDLVAFRDQTAKRGMVMRLDASGSKVSFADQPGIEAVTLSPDGRWAATGTEHVPYARVWDCATGRPIIDLPGGRPAAWGARPAFSPDGRWLAAGYRSDYRIWKAGTWALDRQIPRDRLEETPGPLAFSHDGTLLAIASSSRRITVLEAATGRVIANFSAPDPEVIRAVAFDPKGNRLAAATDGPAVQVWNLAALRGRLSAIGIEWTP